MRERIKIRSITDHIVSGDQAVQLEIKVLDEPGKGGANHEYSISYHASDGSRRSQDVIFQNGPIKEFGVNGITQEALLAIVIDRLRSFQSGPFNCSDNSEALGYAQAALTCLQRRTLARIARGVEGTHQK